MNSGPVVILTALNLEYEAVRNRLTDLLVHRHPAGTRFEVGRLGRNGCRVALGLVGKGNHSAAVLAEGAMVESPPPRRSSSVSLGISDRADGSKTATDGENWQPRAVAHAAAFAAALAQELAADGAVDQPGTVEKGGRAQMDTTNRNIAR